MPDLPLFLRRTPPPEALAWAANVVARGARVESVRRLRGGMSSAVHLLRVRDRRGGTHRVVLRRFVREDWLREEPDLAEREARVLERVAETGIAAPRPLGVDPTGAAAGVPAVLMTYLAGRSTLDAGFLADHLGDIAAMLPRIHQARTDGLTRFFSYRNGRIAIPPWTRRPALWRRALELAGTDPPSNEGVLVHRDYHPGNILWSRGRLSAVVDWVNGCVGSFGIDVGHCRANLAVLCGQRAARAFVGAYEAASGRAHDPRWSLYAALEFGSSGRPPDGAGFRDGGRPDLTDGLVRRRYEDDIEGLVRALR